MILEYSQLLSTAHRELSDIPPEGIYKSTHKHHPCSKWVRQSRDHYIWLYNLLIALHMEYEYRYEKIHASKRLLEALANPPSNIGSGWTDMPQCMPDHCKVEGNVIQAYRQYYKLEKASILKYKKREVPSWI